MLLKLRINQFKSKNKSRKADNDNNVYQDHNYKNPRDEKVPNE